MPAAERRQEIFDPKFRRLGGVTVFDRDLHLRSLSDLRFREDDFALLEV